jgi:hypothetical protein
MGVRKKRRRRVGECIVREDLGSFSLGERLVEVRGDDGCEV